MLHFPESGENPDVQDAPIIAALASTIIAAAVWNPLYYAALMDLLRPGPHRWLKHGATDAPDYIPPDKKLASRTVRYQPWGREEVEDYLGPDLGCRVLTVAIRLVLAKLLTGGEPVLVTGYRQILAIELDTKCVNAEEDLPRRELTTQDVLRLHDAVKMWGRSPAFAGGRSSAGLRWYLGGGLGKSLLRVGRELMERPLLEEELHPDQTTLAEQGREAHDAKEERRAQDEQADADARNRRDGVGLGGRPRGRGEGRQRR